MSADYDFESDGSMRIRGVRQVSADYDFDGDSDHFICHHCKAVSTPISEYGERIQHLDNCPLSESVDKSEKILSDRSGGLDDIEKALQQLWESHAIRPRWAAIGKRGRDFLIAKHGFKPEDFQEFGGLYLIGSPDANAIMDAENA